MAIAQLLKELQYTDSPHFLQCDKNALDRIPDFGHIFRKAQAECNLRGVYVLRADNATDDEAVVPVVYVCEAETDEDANRIHRLVWNQNIVPFILVATRDKVRLYAGFRYDEVTKQPAKRGILEAAIAFNEVADRLSAFKAAAIDDGAIWEEWGEYITPETRVDWKLLANLKTLDFRLCRDGLDRAASHALIGKFVYLRYLRDRDILSDRKLARWGINPKSIFGRNTKLQDFWSLIGYLDVWLNGTVFPIEEARAKITAAHFATLARVFAGDDLETGQHHLDFKAYDFSYIPIETLSVIYEQFLHTSDTAKTPSRGKEVGAYYTPIPLVNFMLSELDAKHQLREGMKVLDPSCGSGAFLVQCFRRLIERQLRDSEKEKLLPSELRQLLEDHIYGVDSDPDACRVAELSLILTLLDYVTPPDLENNPKFKLPTLYNRNIFKADFFDPNSTWAPIATAMTFDWIVGNPPWKDISSQKLSPNDIHINIWKWMCSQHTQRPTGGNQIAEAFVWKVLDHIAMDGVIAFIVPAMSLFKEESRDFRKMIFSKAKVWSVANFANLAEVLFAGRARRPAAALFYQKRKTEVSAHDQLVHDIADERILHYAPLAITEPTHKAGRNKRQQEIWSLTVNASDVKEIRTSQAVTGDMLPWKLALWGSQYDEFVLRKIRNRYTSLKMFAETNELLVHQGLQLSEAVNTNNRDEFEPVPELEGKRILNPNMLRECGHIYTFPSKTLSLIPKERAYARKRGGVTKPLAICRPPHLIIDTARRFAIYSDEFIAVPNKHIGIAGNLAQSTLLCALALYLNSDFFLYHQFLLSAEWGVSTNISNLGALLQLPIPLSELNKSELKKWATLYQRLVAIDQQLTDKPDQILSIEQTTPNLNERYQLLNQLNKWVNDLIGLNMQEQMLIRDLIRIKIPLTQGKVSPEANRVPTQEELFAYALTLKQELDAFIQDQSALRHTITVVYDGTVAMVQIALLPSAKTPEIPNVLPADQDTTNALARMRNHLRSNRSQWVYFERNLRIYDKTTTYLLKPLQHLLWTQSQALSDASEVIADTLTGMDG